jgi:NAD(P)-dependent dehydrogenase (short-subunit alcohol dehydrogenase family)
MMKRLVDGLLEGSVVGSFSRLGYAVRSRSANWSEVDSIDLRGRTVAITGPTSGLGRATTVHLRRLGANVVMIARDAAKTATLADELRTLDAPGDIHSIIADMGDLEAVRRAASELRSLESIDVLVHNAGALLKERAVSPQGLEATIASHVLGPFLMTSLVHDLVTSRVITVSSGGMYAATLPDFAAGQTLEMPTGSYDGTRQYAIAKRAQVTLNEMWAKRMTSPQFFAMHPGWADTPGVQESLPLFRQLTKPLLRTVDEGADSILWLAADPDVALPSGSFIGDRQTRPLHRLPKTRRSDTAANRAALWSWCSEKTGIN